MGRSRGGVGYGPDHRQRGDRRSARRDLRRRRRQSAILTVIKDHPYSSIVVRKWFICLGLIIALASGVVGISAHESDGDCPMGNMPDCCRKAHSAGNSPEVSIARLCCNLNCSEPGSGGNANASSFSSQPGSVPTVAIVSSVIPVIQTYFSLHHRINSPNESSPKYIQHLALLI